MTEVIMIGTGVPEPNPNQQGSCIAILIDGKPILLARLRSSCAGGHYSGEIVVAEDLMRV